MPNLPYSRRCEGLIMWCCAVLVSNPLFPSPSLSSPFLVSHIQHWQSVWRTPIASARPFSSSPTNTRGPRYPRKCVRGTKVTAPYFGQKKRINASHPGALQGEQEQGMSRKYKKANNNDDSNKKAHFKGSDFPTVIRTKATTASRPNYNPWDLFGNGKEEKRKNRKLKVFQRESFVPQEGRLLDCCVVPMVFRSTQEGCVCHRDSVSTSRRLSTTTTGL